MPDPADSSTDLALWHDYLRQLKAFFPFSSTDGSRIYAAPLTAVGISIGISIDQSIVNNDIFRVGDCLLPHDSPIFLPGLSYSKRLLRYLEAVKIAEGNQDEVHTVALEKANKHLVARTDEFLAARRTAYATWEIDPERSTLTFDEWAAQFYPPYEILRSQKDAASQLAYQASEDYYGPQANDLWQDKTNIGYAFGSKLKLPFNMPTSTVQVTTADVVEKRKPEIKPEDIVYEPKYVIDSTFTTLTQNWVLNAKNGRNKPFKITFAASRDSKSSTKAFDDLGFSKIAFQENVAPRLPLFTAEISVPSKDKALKNIEVGVGDGDAKGQSEVKVTIEASDAAVFSITPHQSWDIPNITQLYKLRPDAPEELFDPLVLVNFVLLGYQVAVTIETDETLFKQIDSGLSKVKSSKGSATLLGLKVKAESDTNIVGVDQINRNSETRVISIPPRDSAQLTLLGLMGKNLGKAERAASGASSLNTETR